MKTNFDHSDKLLIINDYLVSSNLAGSIIFFHYFVHTTFLLINLDKNNHLILFIILISPY